MALPRIPARLHVAGEPRCSCALCSTRRRRHPPAPLFGNRSKAASCWLLTTPDPPPLGYQVQETQEITLYLSLHRLARCGSVVTIRTANGAATARGAALPPFCRPPACAPCCFCATILAQARLAEYHQLHWPTFFERLLCCCRRCCCSVRCARYGLFSH